MMRIRRYLFSSFLFLILFTASPAWASLGWLQGWAQRGGETLTTLQGLPLRQRAQRSFPGAHITVYLAGTSTLATLYSDLSSTPLGNPFDSAADASWRCAVEDGSYDVVIDPVVAPPYTLYGVRAFATAPTSVDINVRAYGAKGNSIADDTASFVAAWLAAKTLKNTRIHIPPGRYPLTTALPVIYHSDLVSVVGDGWTNTIILFNPASANQTCMAFEPLAYSTFDRLYVGGFAIFGGTNVDKTLMRVTASANQSVLFDLVLQDTTNTSTTALRWEGWNNTTLRDSWLRAKKPMVWSKPSAGTLSSGAGGMDHMSIINTILFSDYSTNYLIEMSDASSPNIAVSNITISAHAAWNGGKGGIHFSGSTLNHLQLNGVRWEGNGLNTGDTTGRFLDIEPSGANSRHVTLIDVTCGVDQAHDIKLRNITDVGFLNCFIGYGGAWAASEIVLDMDATVDRVWAQNTSFTAGVFNINAALERRWATTTIAGSYNSYASIFWAQRSAGGAQYDLTYDQGVPRYRLRIASLANGASATLISTAINSNDPTPGILFIAAEDAARASGTSGSGMLFSRWDNVVVVTDSPSGIISTSSGTANKLCVFRSGSDIVVQNNLGLAVKIVVLYN